MNSSESNITPPLEAMDLLAKLQFTFSSLLCKCFYRKLIKICWLLKTWNQNLINIQSEFSQTFNQNLVKTDLKPEFNLNKH